MSHCFHFNTYHTATRLHLARELKLRGWFASESEGALLGEQNLHINDNVAEYFEHKDKLAQLLQPAKVSFFPKTYPIDDHNYQQVLADITLQHYMRDQKYQKNVTDLAWILKPAMLNNGDDIKLFHNVEELKTYYRTSNRLGGPHVIQQYITNPAFINQRKATYRFWVVVTNFMGVYVAKQGYVNISELPYEGTAHFSERRMHITNYVLDGKLANIEQRLATDCPDFEAVYSQVTTIVRRCLQLLIRKFPGYLQPSNTNVVELFGFDFTMDDKGQCWLLEINQSPDCPIDETHPLMPSLWLPFWSHIVDYFILPCCGLAAKPDRDQHFHTALSNQEAYSVTKAVLSKLNPFGS